MAARPSRTSSSMSPAGAGSRASSGSRLDMNAPFLPGSIPIHRHFSARRIGALMLRHVYLLRSSWTRLAELIYWPLVQMLMWGFLQTYLNGQTGFAARAGGTLIGAILLW